jgi:hypothetical protein
MHKASSHLQRAHIQEGAIGLRAPFVCARRSSTRSGCGRAWTESRDDAHGRSLLGSTSGAAHAADEGRQMTLSASLVESNNTVIDVGGARYALHVREDDVEPMLEGGGTRYVTIEARQVTGTRLAASHFPLTREHDDRRMLAAVIDHLRLLSSERAAP